MPPSTEHPEGEGGPDEREGHDGPTQDEFDRRFAELTSHPDLHGLQEPAPQSSHPPSPPRPETTTGEPDDDAPEATPSSTLGGPRDYAAPDELDEHFEPPEPEPLTSVDPIRLLAWVGAIAGPIALMLVVMLWSTAPAIVWLTLLAITLLGWGVAFLRLPRSRNDDDDGAVV